jgi:hypothetical protein
MRGRSASSRRNRDAAAGSERWQAELDTVREAGRRAGLASPATAESIARLSAAMGVTLRLASTVSAKEA